MLYLRSLDRIDMKVDKKDPHCIAKTYMFLKRSLSYPKDDVWVLLRDGILQNLLKEGVEELPFEVAFKEIPRPSFSRNEFESQYVNFFEIGFGGEIPYPLYEGLWRTDKERGGITIDLLHFYDYFDMTLDKNERDLPDSLLTELEFMAYLAEKESQSIKGSREPGPYRQAQLGFLEEHIVKWVPPLCKKIQETANEPIYRELSALMERFVDRHLLYLEKRK